MVIDNIYAPQCQDVVTTLKSKYRNNQFVVDKSGCKLVEIMNCNFEANKPFLLRPQNDDYIKREIEWYMSQSLNVNDMPPPVPKVWRQVATPLGFVNSNYGHLVFSQENYEQYECALESMVEDLHTRRAIMIYTRPSMHDDYNHNGKNDFTCTNTVQYLYRDGAIHAIVTMRSNDAIFGYPNDRAWQEYVLEKFVADVQEHFTAKIEKGYIYWNAASMHVYEHHFDLLED